MSSPWPETPARLPEDVVPPEATTTVAFLGEPPTPPAEPPAPEPPPADVPPDAPPAAPPADAPPIGDPED